nr:TolC family protein [Yoonia sp.]
MHVLIIHGNGGLAATWQRHLEMLDAQVTQARTSVAALAALETVIFDVIVLDVMLDGCSALAVADMAQFRQPWATRALTSHPSIIAASAQLRAVQARAERDATPQPYVLGGEVENAAGTGSLRGIDSAETTLRVSRVIELGGKRTARETLGKTEVSLQQHQADTARIDLASRTTARFIEVLARQQRVDYAQERVQQAERTRGEVATSVSRGRNPESDLLAAEIMLAEVELAQETAQHELASARITPAASWGAMTPDFGPVVGDLQTLPPVESFETLAARLALTPELRGLTAPGRHHRRPASGWPKPVSSRISTLVWAYAA